MKTKEQKLKEARAEWVREIISLVIHLIVTIGMILFLLWLVEGNK